MFRMIYAIRRSGLPADDSSSRRPTRAARQALAVIGVATLARLALAAVLGLGIDESYAFAVSRPFSLSYLDHPPLVFWIVGAVRGVTTERVVLRAPFILLFAGTAWLLYRATAHLFGERAAFFTTCVINLAPVFAVSSSGWILPDGPLLFGLALATSAIVRIRFGTEREDMSTHVLLGVGIGIAMLSKYHAVLFVAGLLLWCATDARARELARSRGSLLAALIALAMSTPVIAWNARHDWASLRFQLSRAGGDTQPLVALAQNLSGQAAYLLPWIWVPMVIALVSAGRRGPRDERSWLLFCIAVVPIGLFTIASLGGSAGLPHWPAPGYFFVAPLVGCQLARLEARRGRGTVNRLLAAGTVAIALPVSVIATQARTGWLSNRLPALFRAGDPSLDLLDWTSVRAGLTAAGLGHAREA
ncbi:MAG TPA: glycosyltransferase family 39 protein, partial [Gemmatimonadaceae bacterium]